MNTVAHLHDCSTIHVYRVPKGIQKELTDLSTPSFSSTVFKVTGIVALLEDVLKQKL